jgi:beta-glucosidase
MDVRAAARLLAAALPLLLIHQAAAAGSARRCAATVPRAGEEFVARTMAALVDCQARVVRGRLPPGTDCAARTAADRRRAKLAARLARRVGRACPDAAVASVLAGGDCGRKRTAAELSTCLETTHAGAAEALIAVADAAAGRLAGAALRCRTEAVRRVREIALARLRLLGACRRRPPRRLAPGSDCADDPRLAKRLARRRAHAAARIASRCGGAALAGATFGAPCDAPASGTALATCLLDAAEAAADRTRAAEYAAPTFCGDAGPLVERRIDRLLDRMTVDEKLAQMHGSSLTIVDGSYPTATVPALGIPGLHMIDGPRGVSALTGTATTFPVGSARGATWDPALEERVGEAVGAEARAKGASVLLAPTINLLRHPRWGRAQETYGEDPLHLGRMGAAFVRGVQRHVIANPKHFALNSIENTRFVVDVSVDERTLREVYLPQFRMAVEEGRAASVMSAYNRVNGQFCDENPHLLHDVLKGAWGFQGFVESDWVLGTHGTVPSVMAGLDIEMPTGRLYGPPLTDAVAAGDVPTAVIDEAVRRILRAQLCFRLDSDPPVRDPSVVESPAHAALALEVAEKSLVLLKNAGGALPLDRGGLGTLAVVGPLAAVANLGDRGSSRATPSRSVTPLAGIQAAAGTTTVTHVASAVLSPTDEMVIASADAAVVVVGLTADDEGEGAITVGDRAGLGLPGTQDALVAAVAALNPRTIVVLEGSGALTMPWLDQVAAVLMAWYPGQEGGTAIGEVLFGDVVPSGRLPVAFPVAEADLPPFENTSTAVTYGYLHGYRWLDAHGTAPLFPFGFGLSYTTFAYANPTVTPATVAPDGRVRVTADVTNTGAVAADEVVQLYVGCQGSRVERAMNDLKAFTRVHLAPGETRTVAFDLRAADLAFWDTGAGRWTVEPITYLARVGSSSRDLPLEVPFAVVE